MKWPDAVNLGSMKPGQVQLAALGIRACKCQIYMRSFALKGAISVGPALLDEDEFVQETSVRGTAAAG